MKDRISDENDENQVNVTKIPKPTVTIDKASTVKPAKSTKQASTALALKQALQNVMFSNFIP